MTLHLAIANKRYSSWSMRPWLVLKAFGIAFEETVIPLREPDTASRIAAFSPAGRVPVLVDGDVTVWDSLAIIEYLAERFPSHAIWPADAKARAHARAIAAEMHSGFQSLRSKCSMNLGAVHPPRDRGADVVAETARVEALWAEARTRFGGGGAFLFGAFSAADAMYAPVVTRFDSYSIPVRPETRAYMETVKAHPAFVEWRAGALAETWRIPDYERDKA